MTENILTLISSYGNLLFGGDYITQEEFCANKGRHGHGAMGKGGKQ
ncbi:MAG: hypothetical protein WCA08_22860 [Desulfoferrobacter sp.]